MNWRWPEDKRSGRVAWFVVLRRLTFWPLIIAGVCVAWVGIACGFGLTEAGRFWSEQCR